MNLAIVQSPFGPLCPLSQADVPVTFVLVACFALALFTIAAFVFDAIARERSISHEDFRDANERIVARVTFLTLRQGEDLRWLCMVIARDLIRVMQYVQQQVTECSEQHSSDGPHTLLMFELLRETERIHRTARMIKVALYIRPLVHFAYERTTNSTARFLTRWATLLREYRLKHPECEHRFPA
jgi:hypothetical protein